jgi:hypothetical protein
LARPQLLLFQGPSEIWNAARSLIQRLRFWRWIGKQKQKAN